MKMKQIVTVLTTAAVTATTPLPAFAANTAGTVTANASSILSQAGNGYRERRRYRDHDRISGGDILAGIGILAGIAILADAASSSSKKQRRRDRNPDYNDVPQQPQRSGSSYSGNDVGSAVTACSGAAERSAGNNARVDAIRSVTRAGAGWQVEGNLRGNDNSNFSCGVNNGQIEFVRLNGRDI